MIEVTPAMWAATAAYMLGGLLITFWPTIYALIRKRWRRAAVYFVLCAVAFWIPTHVFSSWEARNPNGDWEFEAPGTLYYGLSWPVMVAVLWTITAITDAIMAPAKPVSANTGN